MDLYDYPQNCPITGEIRCKCLYENNVNITNYQTDLKSTLRKLFTDHAVYTKFVINAVVDGTNDVNILAKRVLQNQVDIGDQLKPYIGVEAGDQLTYLLQTHIKLAKTVIENATKNSRTLQNNIIKLFLNGDEISAFLNSLNPEKIPYLMMQNMFREHNQQVIDMTTLRLHRHHKKEQMLFDHYLNHMLHMSDDIYYALL